MASHYPDSNITFIWDYIVDGAEGYYVTLGGRGTYPYTVILDENGTIVKSFWDSVTYENLDATITQISK